MTVLFHAQVQESICEEDVKRLSNISGIAKRCSIDCVILNVSIFYLLIVTLETFIVIKHKIRKIILIF